jgi:hypothetical protein
MRRVIGAAVMVVVLAGLGTAWGQRYLSGILWPQPPVVTPGEGGAAPSDAVVLFDGSNFDEWDGAKGWKADEDKAFTVKGAIRTKKSFGDMQLHLEFATPKETKDKKGRELKGQARGNNGIGIMSARYEIQVLDNYENTTYPEGSCGSVYNQRPPMVNASRKPGEWQTFDIVFTAPRFGEDGKVQKPGYVTVFHNGVVVQNHTEILGSTLFDKENVYSKHPEKQPIVLMYHGDPVRFRNIWVREVKELVGKPGGPKGTEKK